MIESFKNQFNAFFASDESVFIVIGALLAVMAVSALLAHAPTSRR